MPPPASMHMEAQHEGSHTLPGRAAMRRVTGNETHRSAGCQRAGRRIPPPAPCGPAGRALQSRYRL